MPTLMNNLTDRLHEKPEEDDMGETEPLENVVG
jgi:hypothetical protein